jgi:hypothetical protein
MFFRTSYYSSYFRLNCRCSFHFSLIFSLSLLIFNHVHRHSNMLLFSFLSQFVFCQLRFNILPTTWWLARPWQWYLADLGVKVTGHWCHIDNLCGQYLRIICNSWYEIMSADNVRQLWQIEIHEDEVSAWETRYIAMLKTLTTIQAHSLLVQYIHGQGYIYTHWIFTSNRGRNLCEAVYTCTCVIKRWSTSLRTIAPVKQGVKMAWSTMHRF